MLDLETSQMVRGIFEAGQGGQTAISPHIFQKRLALNIVLMFCYGRRFEDITDPLLLGILSDAKVISRYYYVFLFCFSTCMTLIDLTSD